MKKRALQFTREIRLVNCMDKEIQAKHGLIIYTYNPRTHEMGMIPCSKPSGLYLNRTKGKKEGKEGERESKGTRGRIEGK